MKLYKLTDQDCKTYNDCLWSVGETKRLPITENPRLCSFDVYHAYTSKELGAFLNPIHGNILNPKLFECEGEVVAQDWGKVGVFELKIIREIPFIKPTKKQIVLFSVKCARAVLHIYEQYKPNDGRVRKAIEAAEKYLKNGRINAAAHAAHAAAAAAHAADADADAALAAALAAAHAAAAAAHAYAADADAYAADAAHDAAYAAVRAAYAHAAANINFEKLAKEAMEEVK